ncbi:MAG: sigma-70 family RNA polymerase sigma factor [Gemmatimonadetes bacterium]|nr:sigma-70 family RNA polymerase sigma factor [Gemmatimonadota bacterium]
MPERDADITTLLEWARQGDASAANRAAARVQEALHRIASAALRREADGHTLRPTELADEAFLRLVGQDRSAFTNRAQFYALAARVIRRMLVDHARHRGRQKRDGGVHVTLEAALDEPSAGGAEQLDLLALEDALQKLDTLAPRQAQVVELRFFGGLDIDATAEALSVSPATVKRDWTFARAFLLQALSAA